MTTDQTSTNAADEIVDRVAVPIEVPGWATEREEQEASIYWTRDAEIVAMAKPDGIGAPPVLVRVQAWQIDHFEATVGAGGGMTVERTAPTVAVGNTMLTLAEARRLADAILEVVDAVAGAEL